MKKLMMLAVLLVVGAGGYRFLPKAWAADVDEPICVVTHVDAMPNFTAAARKLLIEFAEGSRKDAGAVRIEIFEELSRPNHSTVVEVWKNRKAYDDHLVSEQTRAYRTRLQPMLGSPFDERLHRQNK